MLSKLGALAIGGVAVGGIVYYMKVRHLLFSIYTIWFLKVSTLKLRTKVHGVFTFLSVNRGVKVNGTVTCNPFQQINWLRK
jgi:hypothetical protein